MTAIRYAQFEFRSADEARRAQDLLYHSVVNVIQAPDGDPAVFIVPLSQVRLTVEALGIEVTPLVVYFEHGDDAMGQDAFLALAEADIPARADQPVTERGRTLSAGEEFELEA